MSFHYGHKACHDRFHGKDDRIILVGIYLYLNK